MSRFCKAFDYKIFVFLLLLMPMVILSQDSKPIKTRNYDLMKTIRKLHPNWAPPTTISTASVGFRKKSFTPIINNTDILMGGLTTDLVEDTLSGTSTSPDCSFLKYLFSNGSLVVMIKLNVPTAQLHGFIDIDIDQKTSTGQAGPVDSMRGMGNGNTMMGVDAFVSIPDGQVYMIGNPTPVATARVDIITDDNLPIVTIPLDVVFSNFTMPRTEGEINVAAIFSNGFQSTDVIPNNGHGHVSFSTEGTTDKTFVDIRATLSAAQSDGTMDSKLLESSLIKLSKIEKMVLDGKLKKIKKLFKNTAKLITFIDEKKKLINESNNQRLDLSNVQKCYTQLTDVCIQESSNTHSKSLKDAMSYFISLNKDKKAEIEKIQMQGEKALNHKVFGKGQKQQHLLLYSYVQMMRYVGENRDATTLPNDKQLSIDIVNESDPQPDPDTDVFQVPINRHTPKLEFNLNITGTKYIEGGNNIGGINKKFTLNNTEMRVNIQSENSLKLQTYKTNFESQEPAAGGKVLIIKANDVQLYKYGGSGTLGITRDSHKFEVIKDQTTGLITGYIISPVIGTAKKKSTKENEPDLTGLITSDIHRAWIEARFTVTENTKEVTKTFGAMKIVHTKD